MTRRVDQLVESLGLRIVGRRHLSAESISELEQTQETSPSTEDEKEVAELQPA